MPEQKVFPKTWILPVVKWVVVAVSAVLIAAGSVKLVTTIYKSTLPKYPLESFDRVGGTYISEPQKDSSGKPVELTDEQKNERDEQIAEARLVRKVNDYGMALGQVLAGVGLFVVFTLIRRSED